MFRKIFTAILALTMLTSVFGAVYARDWDCDFSVIAKPAPEPVPITVPGEEEPIVAIIRDKDGNVVAYVPEGALIITAYADRDNPAVDDPDIKADIKNTLETAYARLVPTPITDLNPGVIPYVQENAPDIDPRYLVVRDLFDARLIGAYAGYLDVPGNTIEIVFDANIANDCFLMVMSDSDIYHNPIWDIIPALRVVRNTDGTVGITFDYLCPIIFVTKCHYAPDNTASPYPPGQPTPDPGHPTQPDQPPPHTGTISFVVLGAALLIIGLGVILLRKKRTENSSSNK